MQYSTRTACRTSEGSAAEAVKPVFGSREAAPGPPRSPRLRGVTIPHDLESKSLDGGVLRSLRSDNRRFIPPQNENG